MCGSALTMTSNIKVYVTRIIYMLSIESHTKKFVFSFQVDSEEVLQTWLLVHWL